MAACSWQRDARQILLVWLCRPPSFFLTPSVQWLQFASSECSRLYSLRGILWPLVKSRSYSQQSSSKLIISTSRRPEGICFFVHSTNTTCCFCCCCHLVILTVRAQGSEYWCEAVYPCLSWYVSKPVGFLFFAGKERTLVGGHPLHMHEQLDVW